MYTLRSRKSHQTNPMYIQIHYLNTRLPLYQVSMYISAQNLELPTIRYARNLTGQSMKRKICHYWSKRLKKFVSPNSVAAG